MTDHSNGLNRFIVAQAPIYPQVLNELKAGRKESHWMWYVFPQIAGLGRSEMAQRYAINSIQEAQCYLEHPILGARLIECTELVCASQGKSPVYIFGTVDALKFHSSMTLFAQIPSKGDPFTLALVQFFAGQADSGTLKILNAVK